MHDPETNTVGRLSSAPVAAPKGRTLLTAAGIFGVLAVAALEIFGFGALLPMAAALLVAAGFAIAAIAWISGTAHHPKDITSWDLAGVLAFLGFAAAIVAN